MFRLIFEFWSDLMGSDKPLESLVGFVLMCIFAVVIFLTFPFWFIPALIIVLLRWRKGNRS